MNENDIERQMQQQTVARPSADLDERMKRLFHEGRIRRTHPLSRTVPFWLMAAACLVCAAAGFAVRPLLVRQQPPSTVVVVVPLNEALARLLTGNSANRSDEIDFSRAQIHVVRQETSASEKL